MATWVGCERGQTTAEYLPPERYEAPGDEVGDAIIDGTGELSGWQGPQGRRQGLRRSAGFVQTTQCKGSTERRARRRVGCVCVRAEGSP